MFTLLLLFPATAIAAVGYLVLYFAGRSDGGMKSFGKLLGAWMMLLSAVVALAAVTGPMFGGRPFGIGPTREERLQRRMEMRQKMMAPGGMGGNMGGPMSGPMGGMMNGGMRPSAPPAEPPAPPPPAPNN